LSISVIFLGTSASIPTPERSLSSIAVKRRGELIIFDCGEGVQRQMVKTKIGFNRKTKILISHMHGDHILGLPGLLQTMSLLGRDKKLSIFGPPDISRFIDAILETVGFTLRFNLEIYEIEEDGIAYRNKEYEIHAGYTEHSTSNISYAVVEKDRPGRFHPDKAVAHGVPEGPLWAKLQEYLPVALPSGKIVRPEDVLDPPRPGRKIVYSGDTRPSEKLLNLSRNADLLIHEATFADEDADRARKDMHSTPSEAAKIAKRARAKLLILTHISARNVEAKILLDQAKKIFPNTSVAEDFMCIELPVNE
jgi:ribonuclease Z